MWPGKLCHQGGCPWGPPGRWPGPRASVSSSVSARQLGPALRQREGPRATRRGCWQLEEVPPCAPGARTQGCGWGPDGRCCQAPVSAWMSAEDVTWGEQVAASTSFMEMPQTHAEPCSPWLVRPRVRGRRAGGTRGNEEPGSRTGAGWCLAARAGAQWLTSLCDASSLPASCVILTRHTNTAHEC